MSRARAERIIQRGQFRTLQKIGSDEMRYPNAQNHLQLGLRYDVLRVGP